MAGRVAGQSGLEVPGLGGATEAPVLVEGRLGAGGRHDLLDEGWIAAGAIHQVEHELGILDIEPEIDGARGVPRPHVKHQDGGGDSTSDAVPPCPYLTLSARSRAATSRGTSRTATYASGVSGANTSGCRP